MTRQMRRKAERDAVKAKTRRLGEPATHEGVASRYQRKLSAMPLLRVEREYKRVYAEAAQMNRVLAAFKMENQGELPLLSSKEAPLALAIGNKFYYIASELHRRGVYPDSDPTLGGEYFSEFFREVAAHAERGTKETVTSGFLNRFTSKVRSLLKGK